LSRAGTRYKRLSEQQGRQHTSRQVYSEHAADLFRGSQQPFHRRGAVGFGRIAIVIQTAFAKDSKIELRCGIAVFCSKKQEPCGVDLYRRFLAVARRPLLLSKTHPSDEVCRRRRLTRRSDFVTEGFID
jgi:hypothetical protein